MCNRELSDSYWWIQSYLKWSSSPGWMWHVPPLAQGKLMQALIGISQLWPWGREKGWGGGGGVETIKRLISRYNFIMQKKNWHAKDTFRWIHYKLWITFCPLVHPFTDRGLGGEKGFFCHQRWKKENFTVNMRTRWRLWSLLFYGTRSY